MPLYLFTDQQFSLAVCRDEQGGALPAGEWRLLKAVPENEVDPAIREKVDQQGHWFYEPGRPPAGRDDASRQ